MKPQFAPRTQKIVQLANQEAQRLESPEIGTGHLLLALIRESGSPFNLGTIEIECDIEAVRSRVIEFAEKPAVAVDGKQPFDL